MDFGTHGGPGTNPPWIRRDDCTSFILWKNGTVMKIEGQSKAILCEFPFHPLSMDGLFCIEFGNNFSAVLIT